MHSNHLWQNDHCRNVLNNKEQQLLQGEKKTQHKQLTQQPMQNKAAMLVRPLV